MKGAVVAGLVATGLLAAGAARAQGVDELGAYGGIERRPARAQRFAIEARVGPYTPNVDDQSAAAPYERSFGDAQRWHAGFEVDWQALRLQRVLSFGPGFSFGYTKSSGKAWLASGAGRSAQITSLTILPMYLAGVVRIDALADNTPVPLVPYAKLGVGYAFWWSNDGDETAQAADGKEAEDTSYGYVWALGAALRLDFLDPDDANTARAEQGIDHSSIFAEWHSSRLDAFGSDDTMDVGTDTIVFGVSIETWM